MGGESVRRRSTSSQEIAGSSDGRALGGAPSGYQLSGAFSDKGSGLRYSCPGTDSG